MKRAKKPSKLHLRRETVRQLGRLDLSRVDGADALAETGDTPCPWTHQALVAGGNGNG